MWNKLDTIGAYTNSYTLPSDGIVSVVYPPHVSLAAIVNDKEMPLHHLHLKAGDTLKFKLLGHNISDMPSIVHINYNNVTHPLHVSAPKTAITHAATNVSVGEHSCHTHHKDGMSYKEKYKQLKKEIKEMQPQELVNVFTNPMGGAGGGTGAAIGGGLGAGVLGGILGGALLGRRGLFGGDGDGAIPLANNIENAIDSAAVLNKLGEIQGAIPLSESQMQLALAGAQNDINSQIQAQTLNLSNQATANANSLTQAINADMLNNANLFAATNANISNLARETATGFGNVSTAIERTGWQVSNAIKADGDQTRSLIQSIDKSNDNRLITTLANEVTELRNEGRLNSGLNGIRIENTNTANATQSQQMQQQQFQVLANLAAGINSLVAQNQTIHQGIINLGSMNGNMAQTAANTRVN